MTVLEKEERLKNSDRLRAECLCFCNNIEFTPTQYIRFLENEVLRLRETERRIKCQH